MCSMLKISALPPHDHSALISYCRRELLLAVFHKHRTEKCPKSLARACQPFTMLIIKISQNNCNMNFQTSASMKRVTYPQLEFTCDHNNERQDLMLYIHIVQDWLKNTPASKVLHKITCKPLQVLKILEFGDAKTKYRAVAGKSSKRILRRVAGQPSSLDGMLYGFSCWDHELHKIIQWWFHQRSMSWQQIHHVPLRL